MIWETLTNRFAVSTSIQKDANSWDFFELNFSYFLIAGAKVVTFI